MLKRLVLAVTSLSLQQMPQQVQMEASSQNVSMALDQSGQDRYVSATSSCPTCSPGSKYAAKGSPAFMASTFVEGQSLVLKVDQPNQVGATLDLGLGPVLIQGTCSKMCLVLVYGSPPNQFLVH